MGKRIRRTFVLFGMAIVALVVLGGFMPTRTVITVTGPDGNYRIEAKGQGAQHVRLELGDGSFVESGSK